MYVLDDYLLVSETNVLCIVPMNFAGRDINMFF